MFMGVQAPPLSHCGLCILPDLRYWWSWQFMTACCVASDENVVSSTLVAVREVSQKKVFSLAEGKKWESSVKDVRNLHFSLQVLKYLNRPKLSLKYFLADKYTWEENLLLPLPHRIPMMASCQREFQCSIYFIFIWASAAFFFLFCFGFFCRFLFLFVSWWQPWSNLCYLVLIVWSVVLRKQCAVCMCLSVPWSFSTVNHDCW